MRGGGDDFLVKPFSQNPEPPGDKIRRALTASGREDHGECASITHQSRGKARAGPAPTPPAGGYCQAVENGRPERWVDAAEYAHLVAEARHCHLYLNLMETARQRSFIGGRRDPKGHYRAVDIPPLPGLVLAAVMRAPRGVTSRALKLHTPRPAQTFREARRLLDLQFPSGDWRSFRTLPGDVPAEATFLLRPPADLRYLLLHNLATEK